MLAQGDDQAVGGGDGLAVDRRHDVAGLDARLGSGTVRGHLGHIGAAVDRQVVLTGNVGVHAHE